MFKTKCLIVFFTTAQKCVFVTNAEAAKERVTEEDYCCSVG